MKRSLFALLAVAAVVLAAPRSASAQTAQTLVKVPFQFIVGEIVLPAGSYRIASETQTPSVLLITSLAGKPVAAFAYTTRTENQAPKDTQAHVAFKNIGGQYFLWQVAVPGSDAREMSFTRAQAERTLAKLKLSPADRADVAK
jgi:hypothetical protein